MGICNSQHKPNTHTHQKALSQQGTTSSTGDDVSIENQSHPNRQGNKGDFTSRTNNNYSALELGEVKGQAEYGSSIKDDNSVSTITSGRSKADIYREMNSSRSTNDIRDELIKIGLSASSDNDMKKKKVVESKNMHMMNYLNLLMFLICTVISIYVGATPVISVSDQTMLLAPPRELLLFWVLVFFVQGVFVIVQMLPDNRSHPLLSLGVSYWYVLTCGLQIGWVFAWTKNDLRASIIAIVFLWLVLGFIVYKQRKMFLNFRKSSWERVDDKSSREDNRIDESIKMGMMKNVLLCLPFQLYFGWITVMMILQINSALVTSNAKTVVQIAVSFLSLIILQIVAILGLLIIRPCHVVSVVIAVSSGAIGIKLSSADGELLAVFQDNVILGLNYTASGVFFITSIALTFRCLINPIGSIFSLLCCCGSVPSKLTTSTENKDSILPKTKCPQTPYKRLD